MKEKDKSIAAIFSIISIVVAIIICIWVNGFGYGINPISLLVYLYLAIVIIDFLILLSDDINNKKRVLLFSYFSTLVKVVLMLMFFQNTIIEFINFLNHNTTELHLMILLLIATFIASIPSYTNIRILKETITI